MKKTFKAAVAAIAVALCASFATAEMGTYIRGDLGYGGIAGFDVMPAFGLMFRPDSDNIFWKGFGAEAQLDFQFGRGVAINPGAMAMWHYYFPESWPVWVQKFVPYVGLGFSIPIWVLDGDTTAGFLVNVKWFGLGYEILPQLMLTFDYTMRFGTMFTNSVDIGVVYKFKGRRNIQQVGEMPEFWKEREEAKKQREKLSQFTCAGRNRTGI